MNLEWDFSKYSAAVYRKSGYLHGILEVSAKPLSEFVGLEKEINLLCKNVESFLNDNGGVNTLLWGARGCGKSSIIKAVFKKYEKNGLRILELNKEFLENLPEILDFLRIQQEKIIIFCDDLSFEENDVTYKNLKSILEGGLEDMPKNVLLFATSNRRHLLPEFHNENEIFGYEGNDDKNALSDRFPLSLGFYALGNVEYLDILRKYFNGVSKEEWQVIEKKALQYATKKGSRNPRSAEHFYKLYKSGLV
ncbi:MAG: DUF815 domain-containing protein [Helicobacteraceae bacterium]|nr:DUF815 domain-containing protein [Helicobacteraceae bacterium]